jgi:YVTN family beta-propeller protein
MKGVSKAKRLVYLLAGISVLAGLMSVRTPGEYLSPGAVAANDRNGTVYTALTSARAIAIADVATGKVRGRIALKRNPNSIILSPDGKMLFVSTGNDNGTVEIFSLPDNKLRASIPAGHTPEGMAVSADGNMLYVAARFSNSIGAIDVSRKKLTKNIPAVREPRSLYISPDGKILAAANFLPDQASTDESVSAKITLIDLPAHTVRSNIPLPDGAQSVAGLTGSIDGKYLYVTHLLSRYSMPVTQIDRGWVNTNALSIIDINNATVYATVLLDDPELGAANPWGICINGSKLLLTLSGSHELMTVDLPALHQSLEETFEGRSGDVLINKKEDISRSLSFIAPFKKRIGLKGKSPRAIACCGNTAFVTSLYSPFLEKINIEENAAAGIIILGEEPDPDAERRGAIAFCDASICYQKWQSCASCHPDARADGLNWDQQNDGLGNPKNTKSLLYSHVTPPSMITGIRATAEEAVRKGILHTLQTVQPESVAEDIDAYLRSLAPVANPSRDKNSFEKGRRLFSQAGCNICHNGEYLTDRTKYDVGTGDGNDAGRQFDTPTLREIWRTAPYLYDGRAKSLRDVLTQFNNDDRHGRTSGMTDEEIDALVLYLNTL